MARATARAVMNGQVSEREFQAAVIAYARLHGWMAYHTHDSRRSEAGFPDLVMLRHGHMVVAELKVRGRQPTGAQHEWLTAFGELAALIEDSQDGGTPARPLVRVFLWFPEDWPEIEVVLR